MIWFWVWGRVRIKVMIRVRIRVKVKVEVTFNDSVYHWSNCRGSKCIFDWSTVKVCFVFIM